jgi:hypothetical protein
LMMAYTERYVVSEGYTAAEKVLTIKSAPDTNHPNLDTSVCMPGKEAHAPREK